MDRKELTQEKILLRSGKLVSPQIRYQWIPLICTDCETRHEVPKGEHEEAVKWFSSTWCPACDDDGDYEEIPHYDEPPLPYLDTTTLYGMREFINRYDNTLFPVGCAVFDLKTLQKKES